MSYIGSSNFTFYERQFEADLNKLKADLNLEISGIKQSLEQAQKDLTDAKSRLTTVETDLTDTNNKLSTMELNLTNINSKLLVIEEKLNKLKVPSVVNSTLHL